MQTLDETERLSGMELLVESGMIEESRIRGGDRLPPGAVPFQERALARWVTPGAMNQLHGVPPIGSIGLPSGWVLADEYNDETADLEVLPFRIPSFSRAYALRCGDRMLCVVRNIQQMEVSVGLVCVVQLNELHAWSAIFGKIIRATLSTISLMLPSGDERVLRNDEIQFIGRSICWWDDEAE